MGVVAIDMSISLDGDIAARNDVPGDGLGEDRMWLHNWGFDDPGVFERVFGTLIEDAGAVIMGRRTYDKLDPGMGGPDLEHDSAARRARGANPVCRFDPV
jgi:dihydrofolate reductase